MSTAFIKPVAFSPIFKMLAFIRILGNNIIDPEKSYDWEQEKQMLWTTEAIRSIYLGLTKGAHLQNEINSLNLGLTWGPQTPPVLYRKPPGHVHFFIQIPNQLVNLRCLRRGSAARWPLPFWEPSGNQVADHPHTAHPSIPLPWDARKWCQVAISTPQHASYTDAPIKPMLTPPHPYPNLIKIRSDNFISPWRHTSQQPKSQPSSEKPCWLLFHASGKGIKRHLLARAAKASFVYI